MISLNLEKGQMLDLTKTSEGLKRLHIGLGWDIKEGEPTFDLDASLFLLKDKKITSPDMIVYFGNLKYGDSVVHTGDNLTGAGDGDDEVILVDLEKLPTDVNGLVSVVNIYNAAGRNFSQVANASIRVLNQDTQVEICKFNLSTDGLKGTAVVLAEFEKLGDKWIMNAIGEIHTADLNALANKYS